MSKQNPYIGKWRITEMEMWGQDENDMTTGRGWAVIKDGGLKGRFYFYLGDDSWFKAKRQNI